MLQPLVESASCALTLFKNRNVNKESVQKIDCFISKSFNLPACTMIAV